MQRQTPIGPIVTSGALGTAVARDCQGSRGRSGPAGATQPPARWRAPCSYSTPETACISCWHAPTGRGSSRSCRRHQAAHGQWEQPSRQHRIARQRPNLCGRCSAIQSNKNYTLVSSRVSHQDGGIMSASRPSLPRGIALEHGRVVVDASFTLIQLLPGVVLISRPGRARPAKQMGPPAPQDPDGWAACSCSGKGAKGNCKVVAEPHPDPSKVTLRCKQGSCTGSCGLAVGKWSETAAFTRAITAVLEQHVIAPAK
jgi:hypothetical protein